jgi:hypothetical protein
MRKFSATRQRKKRRNRVSESNDRHDVQVDWRTAVPMGDTLAVRTGDGVDDRWVEAFEVVVDEHDRQASDQKWNEIDFEYASGDSPKFVIFVREIEPGAQSFELRRTVEELVNSANAVARVGTHVYEIARELRQPPAPPATAEDEAPREGSVPPPSFDPLEDELDADAA